MIVPYYDDTEVGSFQYCSVCRQIKYGTQEGNPLCIVCNTQICPDCYQYGFCPRDFGQLKKEQQKVLIEADENYRQFQKRTTLLIISMRTLGLCGFLILVIGLFFNSEVVYTTGFMLMILVIWFGILIWLILRKIEIEKFKNLMNQAVWDMLQSE